MRRPASPNLAVPRRPAAWLGASAVLAAALLLPAPLAGQAEEAAEEATPSLEAQLERAQGAERVPLLVALVAALHANAPDLATRYGEEALTLLERHPDPAAEVATLNELGSLYVERGELERGEAALRRGLALAEQQRVPADAAACLLGLAGLERRRGRLAEAEAHARRAVALAEEASAQDTLQRAYHELAAVYEAAARPGPALDAFKRLVQVRDQNEAEQRALRLATLEGRFESERRERESERLTAEQALAALAQSRDRWRRNAIAAGVVLLAFAGFALYRRERDLRAIGRRVEELSLTDPLTGLKNRRFVDHAIEADAAASRRRHVAAGPDRTAAQADLILLLIDLDHLKAVNDEHGHAAGDAVLAQLAEILRGTCRASDHLLRWGGEEFLAVVRFVDRAEGAALAERIRGAVAAHTFRLDGERSLRRTCSLGYAPYPLVAELPESLSWEQVLGLADDALRAAKRSGRDAWVGVARASAEALAGLSGPQRDLGAEVARGEVEVESSLPPAALRWSEVEARS